MKNQLGRDGKSCCELCEKEARMHCESDKARLCFDCDRKVHAANFLVAKHCRTLLCHLCRSITPWKAAGPNLGSVVALCHDCVSIKSNCTPRVPIKAVDEVEKKTEPVREEEDDVEDEDLDAGDGGDEDEESCGEIDEEEDEDEDDENQVVPWTRTPPPASGASGWSSGEEELGFGGRLKRVREVGIRQHDDDDDDDDDDSKTMSPRWMQRGMESIGDESTSFRFMGLSKHRRITLQV